MRHLRYRLLALVLLAFCLPAVAQPARQDHEKEVAEFIRANYTKYEYRISMRDGVHLFTAVYVPKDASDANRYPIMFDRTPYSVMPYGADNYPTRLGPSEVMMRARYIFALQDVRGRFMSDGEFVNMRPHNPHKTGTETDEASDTYDSIEWLVKNVPYNNGKVGMWGISYPGFYTAAGMIDAHPALKAASPQAPIADWFIGDDFHHHGALWLPHFFNFISVFGLPRTGPTKSWQQREFEFGTRDGYNFFLSTQPLSVANERYLKRHVAFWDELTQHPNYDAFWKARSLPQHLKNIKPAVMVVGGWFDAENLYGALHTYEATSKNNPAGPVTLVMGPWFHGGWARSDGDRLGDVQFNSKTSVFYREQIEASFFEYHLKGKGEAKLPAAYVFETGTNQWRQYDSWPPKNTVKKALYFGANGKLSFEPPPAPGGYDEYVSDPAKPVPFTDVPNIGMMREYMAGDQRLQGRRTDVLVYQTEPLEEDVTLAGPIQPSLFVSTSGTDSDWVVKLIDVYPPDFGSLGDRDRDDENPGHKYMGDYQQLVRGEAMRGRFRNSYEKPGPFVPGKVTKVEFVEPDVYHTFRRGHRIMVQVQSSWFPLVDLNPQKFVPNIYEAKKEDFQKATQRVYHTADAPSKVNVTVLQQ
ncbi:MAG: CocE/NonD family hydrolase [Terriglobales bacterium]